MEIAAGAKVKLKTDKILNMEGYSSRFKSWVSEHRDKILTVEYENPGHKPLGLFCLKEDKSTIRWLINIRDVEVIKNG